MTRKIPLVLALVVLPGAVYAQAVAAPTPSVDWNSDPMTGFQAALKDNGAPQMPSQPAAWGQARVDAPAAQGQNVAIKASSVEDNPSLAGRFNNTGGYYPQQPVPTKPFQNYVPPTTQFFYTPRGVFIEPPNSGTGYRTIISPNGGTYVIPPTVSPNYNIIITPNGNQRIILPMQQRNYQLTTPPGLRAPFP